MSGRHTVSGGVLLAGIEEDPGLVAVEHLGGDGTGEAVRLFFRRDGGIESREDVFRPYLFAEQGVLDACPGDPCIEPLHGKHPLNRLVSFSRWDALQQARKWLAKTTGYTPRAAAAPFYVAGDPVQQYLMHTRRTHFQGLRFEQLARLQVDIECRTTEGFDFCNADREGDRILAIGLGLPDGQTECLSTVSMSEKALLETFVERVRAADPDVIEGHNIFNFDLPYLAARAKRHGVKLALGRDGSAPRRRASQMAAGERTIAYERFDVFGRHVVDTLHLVQIYDISHRSLDSFGLKAVAAHFGVSAPDRTMIEGDAIGRVFESDPEKVLAYLRDDVAETRAVADLLARSAYVQSQLLPYSYQDVCVRGNATKIDALMIREYLGRRTSLPRPDAARRFAGGYTDLFMTGVIENVHHCDVRSLYPSLMLAGRLGPRTDTLGVFLSTLEALRAFRLEAKTALGMARKRADRLHYDALQTSFKVLINSFYGYLGFGQARFNDFDAAEAITRNGRELLRDMIAWLRKHGAQPVEIDTDGIYFVPPPFKSAGDLAAFRKAFAASLPGGIEVEFDGEYRSMYSYKMKNYALLDERGDITITGAALKSRGLEPFQRAFLRELIRLKLEEREPEIEPLRAAYEKAIRGRAWPIRELAKTETLQDSPATYSAKRDKGKTPRRAAYELALASGRAYRAGDQVAYYVTGTHKRPAVHENAKLASDWNPEQRDENVEYYVAKLQSLYEKFVSTEPVQPELEL